MKYRQDAGEIGLDQDASGIEVRVICLRSLPQSNLEHPRVRERLIYDPSLRDWG